MARISQQQLEAHLMGAAAILRGKTAGQDYKTYILGLMFYKRLCDQWQREAEALISAEEARTGKVFTDKQHSILLRQTGIHRFDIPRGAAWNDVRNTSVDVGQALTKAQRSIEQANPDLKGVFTVDWGQPAPDGSGPLLSNGVVVSLLNHFHPVPLDNGSVDPDVLGRAYEYLIKMFADDAGARAGEFFTPRPVVDILVRCTAPKPGECIYDPTCGSAGMLVHSGEYLRERGYRPDRVRYRGQEMNWATYAIARINTILHGMDADIRGGKSTIHDPLFRSNDGSVEKFDVVLANFPFSDSEWWVGEDRSEEHVKQEKKKIRSKKERFTDPFKRFTFGQVPISNGDYAFIQHIIASMAPGGRAGVVCPQGVLTRGKPQTEEQTGELDAQGVVKVRRRKADDEQVIRRGLLERGLVETVVTLPVNIFYGAGVPACLLILRQGRGETRDVLLVDGSRDYEEAASRNQLRAHDVMRILVHVQARGDKTRAEDAIEEHEGRLLRQVEDECREDIARLVAEHEPFTKALAAARAALAELPKGRSRSPAETSLIRHEAVQARFEAERLKIEEDARLESEAVKAVAGELRCTYSDPADLVRRAYVATLDEIEENEFNLGIARYVDTYLPSPARPLVEAWDDIAKNGTSLAKAIKDLEDLLKASGLLAS